MWPVAGMLKVPGLMPPRCKMFDTPGVPHAHQLSSRLNSEEVSSSLHETLQGTLHLVAAYL